MIQELKAFAKPPEAVTAIFDVVSTLFGQPKGWREAQKLMGNPQQFIKSLKSFNTSALAKKPALMGKVKKQMQNPDLSPESLKNKSAACEVISIWINAVIKSVELPDEKRDVLSDQGPVDNQLNIQEG